MSIEAASQPQEVIMVTCRCLEAINRGQEHRRSCRDLNDRQPCCATAPSEPRWGAGQGQRGADWFTGVDATTSSRLLLLVVFVLWSSLLLSRPFPEWTFAQASLLNGTGQTKACIQPLSHLDKPMTCVTDTSCHCNSA